ncbi:serine protease SP24D-like [Ochlerotatus camptorhynchus]|uniref:serine protease SP24D-like n=1 Tax=Ochlerotatus camptorhynchus TaxID=644619 RepID=UPI0031DD96D9
MHRVVLFSVLAIAASSLAMAMPSSKIVGGQFAEQHQFPYQVALFFKDRFRCGGSIIDNKWILTAAHCVLDGVIPIAGEDLTVYAGSARLEEEGQFFTVYKAYPHEHYGDTKNDIALIELDYEIEFDDTVEKVELFNGELKHGDEVVISGYGRVGTELPASEQLKYNAMYVQDDELCSALMAQTGPGLICLNNEANNGACMGDSGGPAVYEDKLVGVANFVLNECGTVYPDGYAKVAFFRDWIDGVMKQ